MNPTLTRDPIVSGTSTWSHQKGDQKATWYLRSGSRAFASLFWERRFGSSATARTAALTWRFDRKGFLRRRILVYEGSDKLIGEFHPRWTGAGTLLLDGGKRFEWKAQNFWSTQWSWFGSDGTRLVDYSRKMFAIRLSAETTITHVALKYAELPLLVTFGWYLCILARNDRAHA